MADWKENKVVGIVAGIIFILSMIWAGITIFTPKKIEMTLMSEAGSDIIKMKVLPNVEFPVLNPKTGNKDLYPAVKLKCTDGFIFYKMIKTTDKTAPLAMYTCPKDPSQSAVLVQE